MTRRRAGHVLMCVCVCGKGRTGVRFGSKFLWPTLPGLFCGDLFEEQHNVRLSKQPHTWTNQFCVIILLMS